MSRSITRGEIFIILSITAITIDALHYQMLRYESEVKPDKIWDISKLKLVRLRLGEYGLDGPIQLLQTLDNTTTFELKIYQSATGNGVFTLTPFRFPIQTYCDFLNTYYKKYYMPKAMHYTDFPVIGDEYYCPMEKAQYHFYKFVWTPSAGDGSVILKPGYYRYQQIYKLSNGEMSIIAYVFKVTLY